MTDVAWWADNYAFCFGHSFGAGEAALDVLLARAVGMCSWLTGHAGVGSSVHAVHRHLSISVCTYIVACCWHSLRTCLCLRLVCCASTQGLLLYTVVLLAIALSCRQTLFANSFVLM